jgi:hypothetical protein
MYDDDNPSIVVLKREWDYSPHIDENKILLDTDPKCTLQEANNNKKETLHCHVIRKIERDYLKDFFRRRREGALLVCGRRGVGKTSAIAAAILASQEILKQEKKIEKPKDAEESIPTMRLLPVLVNAPNFEIRKTKINDNDKSEHAVDFLDFKRLVLQNLVRGVYQAAVKNGIIDTIDIANVTTRNQDSRSKSIHTILRKIFVQRNINPSKKRILTPDEIELKNKISNLFRRAVAKEVKTQSNLKEIELEKYLLEKQATYNINWSLVAKTTAISLCSALAAAFSLPLTGLPEVVTRIVPIVISITPPSIVMSWQVKKTTTNQTEAEKNASIYYLYDYDISTLQSELEETIRKLTENNYKVIFVIDELDKIDEKDVIEVTKSLKSLLNQASALFVLIGGQEFFKVVMGASEDRGKEYTLFSQKIFLRRPQFVEIKKFMDNIVDSATTTPLIKLFRWDEIKETIILGEILKKAPIGDEHYDTIRDAEVTKSNDVIKISLDRAPGGNYVVEIKNDDSEPDAVLRIPSSTNRNESVEYEFAVMKDNNNESFVYTRTKEYRDFQYYAAFASKSDFFDLYNVLRDNVFYPTNDGKPRLRIELDEKQLTQAKLQEIMTEIYLKEEYIHPSKWQENDRLLSLMYGLITNVSELRGNATRLKIERTPFRIVFLNNDNKPVAEVPDKEWYEKMV